MRGDDLHRDCWGEQGVFGPSIAMGKGHGIRYVLVGIVLVYFLGFVDGKIWSIRAMEQVLNRW